MASVVTPASRETVRRPGAASMRAPARLAVKVSPVARRWIRRSTASARGTPRSATGAGDGGGEVVAGGYQPPPPGIRRGRARRRQAQAIGRRIAAWGRRRWFVGGPGRETDPSASLAGSSIQVSRVRGASRAGPCGARPAAGAGERDRGLWARLERAPTRGVGDGGAGLAHEGGLEDVVGGVAEEDDPGRRHRGRPRPTGGGAQRGRRRRGRRWAWGRPRPGCGVHGRGGRRGGAVASPTGPGRLQAVVDSEDDKRAAMLARPVRGQQQQGGGVPAAGDGHGEWAR